MVRISLSIWNYIILYFLYSDSALSQVSDRVSDCYCFFLVVGYLFWFKKGFTIFLRQKTGEHLRSREVLFFEGVPLSLICFLFRLYIWHFRFNNLILRDCKSFLKMFTHTRNLLRNGSFLRAERIDNLCKAHSIEGTFECKWLRSIFRWAMKFVSFRICFSSDCWLF